MSGGHFDYIQNRLNYDVIDEIACEIERNQVKPEWTSDEAWARDGRRRWREATIAEFEKGMAAVKRAYVYIQRIDWLLSGDDDEDDFHRRLKEDLSKIENDAP